MAFSKMDAISWKFTGQPYDLNSVLTPDQVWAKLDLPSEEVRSFVNALIDKLNSVIDSSSGADNLGMTPIPTISPSANTAQAIMEALSTRLQAITDNASGADFIGLTSITGVDGTKLQTFLENLKDYIDSQDDGLQSQITDNDNDISSLQSRVTSSESDIDALQEADGQNVKVTGNQTIAGTKMFSSSPVVPTPTTDMQATNKKYIYDNFTSKDEITTNRKLSATGDFRGTLNGYPIVQADPGYSSMVAGINDTLNAHLAENAKHTAGWVNVLSYGAVGDGVADDTAALQNAINAFPAFGGVLLIPSGYKFKHTGINIKNPNITLCGGGTLYGASLLIGDVAAPGGVNLNITVDNIIFEYDSVAVGNNGIEIINGRKIKIAHCSFNNCDKAVYTYPVTGGFHRNGLIVIDTNLFNAVNYCFYVDNTATDWQNTNDCHFTNNIANVALINGIYIKGIDGIIIEGNTFFFPSYNASAPEIANKNQSIYIDGLGSDWVHIKNNNLFEAGAEGILASNLKRFAITGNNIAWCGQRVMSSAIKLIGAQDSQGCINNNTLNLFTKNGIEINITGSPIISVSGNSMNYLDTNPYYYGNSAPYANGVLSSVSHYGNFLVGTNVISNTKIGINAQNVPDSTGGEGLGLILNTRSCLTSVNKTVSVTVASTPILTLYDFKGEQTNYDGILIVTARNSANNSANTASYVLALGKHAGGSGLTLLSSNGLTTGGSASHPSFTFSLDSTNNALLATPVAATSAPFLFYVTALHNLKIK